MRVNAIANGLGAQSMWLVVLAIRGAIPATVSITADTGSEEDRVWSTGERTTAYEYWERVCVPLCLGHIDSAFVRARDKDNRNLPPLYEHVNAMAAQQRTNALAIPLFGSKGGRRPQTCTDKWKIRALRQEARRIGATEVRFAQGIHFGEAARRVSGRFIGMEGGWSLYQDVVRRKKVERDVKWCSHYYPLVDLKLRREDVQKLLAAEGIPYLLSSECDFCPHQDLARWERHTTEKLFEIAAVEHSLGGKFFFTDERVPLFEALDRKRIKQAGKVPQGEIDFGCENGVCGI